ncbi:Hypothetical_protein [Hexamita inflata]|uniref:Hypothetical_protein n=1 Tax=Hexamita inflata TaxID=28002 RepID=A0AA86P2Q3_9EUKA|nr:Hypothetical protein HINF_LOCUS18544 [Hexamita inflata]
MSSIVDGYSEPVRSSVALGFAFLPCSHTLEAWRRSRCPSSGSLTVSLTLLCRDGAFMQSISDQAGVMQLGFFVSARYCKAAVFAQEGVRDLWQECCQHVHGFLVHSAVVTKNEWNHPIIAIRAGVSVVRILFQFSYCKYVFKMMQPYPQNISEISCAWDVKIQVAIYICKLIIQFQTNPFKRTQSKIKVVNFNVFINKNEVNTEQKQQNDLTVTLSSVLRLYLIIPSSSHKSWQSTNPNVLTQQRQPQTYLNIIPHLLGLSLEQPPHTT